MPLEAVRDRPKPFGSANRLPTRPAISRIAGCRRSRSSMACRPCRLWDPPDPSARARLRDRAHHALRARLPRQEDRLARVATRRPPHPRRHHSQAKARRTTQRVVCLSPREYRRPRPDQVQRAPTSRLMSIGPFTLPALRCRRYVLPDAPQHASEGANRECSFRFNSVRAPSATCEAARRASPPHFGRHNCANGRGFPRELTLPFSSSIAANRPFVS